MVWLFSTTMSMKVKNSIEKVIKSAKMKSFLNKNMEKHARDKFGFAR